MGSVLMVCVCVWGGGGGGEGSTALILKLGNVLSKAFQICESLSLATILVKQMSSLVTGLYQNTASESAVLDPPPPPPLPLVAREQSSSSN